MSKQKNLYSFFSKPAAAPKPKPAAAAKPKPAAAKPKAKAAAAPRDALATPTAAAAAGTKEAAQVQSVTSPGKRALAASDGPSPGGPMSSSSSSVGSLGSKKLKLATPPQVCSLLGAPPPIHLPSDILRHCHHY